MSLRDYLLSLKIIATAINPVAGGVISLVDTFYRKPKEKVSIMMDGKKTYIGI